MANKTRQDALDRIKLADAGSLSEQPTMEYLKTLEEFLGDWKENIEDAITDLMEHCPGCLFRMDHDGCEHEECTEHYEEPAHTCGEEN